MLSSDDFDELSPEKDHGTLHKCHWYLRALKESEHDDGEARAEELPRSQSQQVRHSIPLLDDDDKNIQGLPQCKSGVLWQPLVRILVSCSTFKWVTIAIADYH